MSCRTLWFAHLVLPGGLHVDGRCASARDSCAGLRRCWPLPACAAIFQFTIDGWAVDGNGAVISTLNFVGMGEDQPEGEASAAAVAVVLRAAVHCSALERACAAQHRLTPCPIPVSCFLAAAPVLL